MEVNDDKGMGGIDDIVEDKVRGEWPIWPRGRKLKTLINYWMMPSVRFT